MFKTVDSLLFRHKSIEEKVVSLIVWIYAMIALGTIMYLFHIAGI